jgi:PAS domain S-box-containing protein
MRGQDQEQSGGVFRGRALGIRSRLTVAFAAALAIVAMVIVVALTWHVSATRNNQDRLDDIVVQLSALQDAPWRLQAASADAQDAARLDTEMSGTEQTIEGEIKALERVAPAAALTSAQAPLRLNFAALGAMVRIIASGNVTGLTAAANAVSRTHDAVVASLNRARSSYRSGAHGTLWEATLGTAFVLALLLGGFVIFYLRSVKARNDAEALTVDLELSRQHLEHAQRIAGVGSWEWNDRDRIVRWSPEQSRIHGWHRPEPPGRPGAFLQLISPDDRRRVGAAMQAAFVEGESIELEYRVAESRGGRLIHVQASNRTEADGRRRLIGTSQDMTERFRQVEAERANRAKDEFISRMSHELRTPLNAVLGFGQLMSMSDLDERQHGNVEHILSAGRHLLDLINEILDISRIESGDMRLSLEPVALQIVLVDAADLVTPEAHEHAITVAVEQESDLWVRADVQRVRQVLLNLLSNAVKYNVDGGRVWVRAYRTDAGRVRIEVQDDGPGIAPDMIERLFSPFERLGAEHTAVEGTGLGLAVSRGMIEAMGGRISVRSVVGEGSTFVVELAASAPAALSDVAKIRSVPAQRALVRQKEAAPPMFRVLCVEDNPTNVELIEQILSARPWVELLTAGGAERGLELARVEQPDLVLLDLDLPDIRGEVVLTELQDDPATERIPVVILSAATLAKNEAERLLAIGARSYITKPPGVTALLEAVDDIAEPLPNTA